MGRRAAICAVAQTTWERDKWYVRQQGLGWEITESLLSQTGLDFKEGTGIGQVVTVSDDLFDGRTISNNAMTDVVGARRRRSRRTGRRRSTTRSIVLSGQEDVVLVVGHCKEASRRAGTSSRTWRSTFFTRPVGLDYLAAAGIQAGARRGRGHGRAARQLVVRARNNAAKPEGQTARGHRRRGRRLADARDSSAR